MSDGPPADGHGRSRTGCPDRAYPLLPPYLRGRRPGLRGARHALASPDDPVPRTLVDAVPPACTVRNPAREPADVAGAAPRSASRSGRKRRRPGRATSRPVVGARVGVGRRHGTGGRMRAPSWNSRYLAQDQT